LRLGFLVLKTFDILLFLYDSLDKDIQTLLKLLQLSLLKLASSRMIRPVIYGRENMHIIQVCEPGDLSLKAQSSFTLFLGELQLTSFIVPNIRYAYLAAESPENLVLSCTHNGCEVLNLFM
jgi:hypothetical protein